MQIVLLALGREALRPSNHSLFDLLQQLLGERLIALGLRLRPVPNHCGEVEDTIVGYLDVVDCKTYIYI